VEPLRRPATEPVERPARQYWAAYAHLLAVAAAVIVVDQITKALVISNLAGGRVVQLFGGLIRLVYARNSGAAFGIFPDRGTLFAVVAAFVTAAILLSYRRLSRSPAIVRIAAGLLLGGALGNFSDRIRLGYVVDFIDLGWFPVFNLADSSIVLGVLTLFVYTALTQDRTG